MKIIRKKWRNERNSATWNYWITSKDPWFLIVNCVREERTWENTEDNLDKIRKTVFSHKFITFTHSQKPLMENMFPGYVWNDVGNEVGRIGNYRTPHSPHSERRINWSKRGPKWDLAQEVKYSNLFSFLPCSVSWSVFLFPRGNHSPVSSLIV